MARAIARRPDATRAFSLSIAAMAIVDPLVAYDLSFLLSPRRPPPVSSSGNAARGGLSPRASLRSLLPAVRALATTLAASIACAPVIARFAPSVPIGGIFANLVAVPLGELAALPLCIVHALLGFFPDGERGTAVLASGALHAVRAVARAFSAPWSSLEVPPPTDLQLVLLATGAAVCLAWRGGLRRAGVLVLALSLARLELRAREDRAPRGCLRATFLDVGQGDMRAIVDLPSGEAIVDRRRRHRGEPGARSWRARPRAHPARDRRRSAVLAAMLSRIRTPITPRASWRASAP